MNIIRAGTLLYVDEGEYSEYDAIGFFVVLKDFTLQAQLDSYLGVYPEQQERFSFNRGKFLEWLISQGFLMELEYGTLHLTSQSNYDEVRFFPYVNRWRE